MLLPKGKDFRLLFERPPYAEWDVGAALAAVEMYVSVSLLAYVLFGLAMLLFTKSFDEGPTDKGCGGGDSLLFIYTMVLVLQEKYLADRKCTSPSETSPFDDPANSNFQLAEPFQATVELGARRGRGP